MKIRIETDCDFTPSGKRRVSFSKQHGKLYGYVSGHIFREFNDMASALEWRDNKTNLNQQPWRAFK